MTLETLNEDCLRKIISYLNFEDKLTLWTASEPNTLLNFTLSYAWERQKAHQLGMAFDGKPSLLDNFLHLIKDTVEDVTFHSIDMKQVLILRKHFFPQTRTLQYCNRKCLSFRRDYDLTILAHCFPNIHSLSFRGHSSVHCVDFIRKWNQIRELDMKTVSMDLQTIKMICQKFPLRSLAIRLNMNICLKPILKLQDLEELDLSTDLTEAHIGKLLELPKLRKLRFCNIARDEVLQFIGRSRGPYVVGLKYNDYMCFAFDLNNLLQPLEFLETLKLVYFRFGDTADRIWHILSICPKLKSLYFYEPKVNVEIFVPNSTAMIKALEKRSEPLQVNFYGPKPNITRSRGLNHPKLKLYFYKDPPFDLHNYELIEFEFKPLQA